MQRFDDFNGGFKRYNNQPFTVGVVQPLGQFNGLKWARAIEPLRYQESLRRYVGNEEGKAPIKPAPAARPGTGFHPKPGQH